MYNCKKCGIIENDWCDTCEKIVNCDCSDMTYSSFKDLIFDTNSGERTVTIKVYHCKTCGEIAYVDPYPV